MFGSIKRLLVLMSVLVTVAMATNVDIAAVKSGRSLNPADIVEKGQTALKAVDFGLKDGLAQLVVKRTDQDTYVARLDLKETLAKLGEGQNLALLLALAGFWVLSPIARQMIKDSRRRRASAPTAPAHPSILTGGAQPVKKLKIAEAADLFKQIAGSIKTAAPDRLSLRIKTYKPRHAAGRPRRRLVIVHAGR